MRGERLGREHSKSRAEIGSAFLCERLIFLSEKVRVYITRLIGDIFLKRFD